jgi:dienelactone hydrolase
MHRHHNNVSLEEVTMFRTLLSMSLFLMAFSSPLHAEIRGEIVNYQSADTRLLGYIAYDDAIQGQRPGVIVVPDWWGHGKFARDRARALAGQGYTAMVMDLYGEGKYVDPPEQAKALMNQFTANPAVMEARFDATRNILASHKTVNHKRLAAIGYSLGGLVVLEMARRGKDLAGIASIWGVIGQPTKPAGKGEVRAAVLIQQAETDGWAPIEQVRNLENEMKNAGTSIKVITYPGTVHGYSREDATIRANKYNLGIRYHAEATKQSRQDLNAFLRATLN